MIRARLADHLESLLSADPRCRVGEGADAEESVHDARVAIRRLRSDLRTFGPALEPGWAKPLRAEMAWWSDQLGEVRDAEVLFHVVETHTKRLDVRHRRAADALLRVLAERGALRHTEVLGILDGERFARLLERLAEASRAPRVDLVAGELPARELVPELVARSWKSLRRAVAAAGRPPTPAELHRIRIIAKRTRYAAETAAIVGPSGYRRLGRRLAALQDHLGDHHDAVQAQAWLAGEAIRAVDREWTFVAGVLAGMLRDDELRLADSWRAVWQRAARAAAALDLRVD